MDIFKAVTAFTLSTAILIFVTFTVMNSDADGLPDAPEAAAVQGGIDVFDPGPCASAAIYECSTGTLLGSSGNVPVPAGQLVKLMTFLIAAEGIESGRYSLSDRVTASKNAFDQKGSSIWLGIGEKITLDELMKAISIGNANDAAAAIAEQISGSCEAFVKLMNSRAEDLGMTSTHFADCTGASAENVSTGEDICRLCAELVRHREQIGYFTVWMDTVRGGRAELVSRNRLIRDHSGIKGFKVCSTAESGCCAAVCAEREGMTLCLTVMGALDEEELLSRCSELLDSAFAEFTVYTPELPEELSEPVRVEHGQLSGCPTEIPSLRPLVVNKEKPGKTECTFRLAESVKAPVTKGQPLGNIVFTCGGEELLSADICAKQDIAEADLWFCFKRVLFNLLNI